MAIPKNDISNAAGPGLAGRRVLVIEDESMIAMLIKDILVDIGCAIAGTASRLNEALGKARSLSFDIAVVDINLNGQWTFPVAEALTERGLPFVFVTGYGPSSLPAPLRDAPVVQKPFQQRDLEKALRAALE